MNLLVIGLYLKSYLQGSTFAQDRKEYKNWVTTRWLTQIISEERERGVQVILFIYWYKIKNIYTFYFILLTL